MRILFTNHHLAELGGTELFIREITMEWKRRGHEVAVLTTRTGPVSEALVAAGVPVTTDVGEVPFQPELIHGQHHLPTMMAVCAFPGVPVLYHCHGYVPWQEQPPAHPSILKYLGMAGAMREWLIKKNELAPEMVQILPIAVDTEVFTKVRVAVETPRTALLFGNRLGPADAAVKEARQASEKLGIRLDTIGVRFGTAREHPETWLIDYDLVFASGRSALEAMACGCGVIPFDSKHCHDLITEENFSKAQHLNFTVPSDQPAASAERITAAIHQYSREAVAAVTTHVRRHCSFIHFSDELEGIHRSLIQRGPLVPDPAANQKALAGYLKSLGGQMDALEADNWSRRDRLEVARVKQQELQSKLELERQKSEATKRVLSAGFLSRRLLRKIHRQGKTPAADKGSADKSSL